MDKEWVAPQVGALNLDRVESYMRYAEAVKLDGKLLTISSASASQDWMCGDA